MNVLFFQDIVRLVKNQQDCRVIANTDNNENINIVIKEGNIVDFTCGELRGVKAVTSSRNQKIIDYQIQNDKRLEIPAKRFPFTTKSVLKILSSTLPEYISYDPEQIVINENNIESDSNSQVKTGNRVRAFEPNNKLTEVKLDLVYDCLKKVFGPISDVIYQDAISEIPSISTNQDLADLINLICMQIQDEEVKYQKEFLNLLEKHMADLLNIEHF